MSTSAWKLVFHILGALAEFKRDLIRVQPKGGLRAAREREKTGGRPPALDEGDIKLAQRLIQDPDVPVEMICERLGISLATLYRYVGPDGSRWK
jgi:DNA invertase Pin-like site-specific DNA recombinase